MKVVDNSPFVLYTKFQYFEVFSWFTYLHGPTSKYVLHNAFLSVIFGFQRRGYSRCWEKLKKLKCNQIKHMETLSTDTSQAVCCPLVIAGFCKAETSLFLARFGSNLQWLIEISQALKWLDEEKLHLKILVCFNTFRLWH